VTYCSPAALREVQARRAYALLLFFSYIFSDFSYTNFLDNYRIDLHEICRIGRTLAVDEDLKLFFFDTSRDFAVATSSVGQLDLQYTPCSSPVNR